MKYLLISILLFTIATIAVETKTKTITIRDVIVEEHLTKIQNIETKKFEEYQLKPVYCSDHLKEYGWNHTVAHNVMMVESTNQEWRVNDNPSTGDYSVGCFQINLLGGNLQSKYNIAKNLGYNGSQTRSELEKWLKSAENNVRVAYYMYERQGWSPWSFTTCKKVACY